MDLHLELDGRWGRRAALEDALRDAIRNGRLEFGTMLPSTRSLAVDLGVARGTVVEAYNQLIAEGLLDARTGSGTRVAWTAEPAADARRRRARVPEHSVRFDWQAGRPDPSSFPRRAWLRATTDAITAAPDDAFGLGDPRGDSRFRSALCDYLRRVRGVLTDPNHIVVTAGYTQALDLIARVLASRGAQRIVTEDPGISWNRIVVERAGLRTRTLHVDHGGADVERLTEADSAVILTPAHQYPLGVALEPSRRLRVVDWANATGAFIIEDDYDGEFRYDRQPVGALQALAPNHVAYVGTTSKTISPAVRLGWIVAPPALLEPMVEVKRLMDQQTGVLQQLALEQFITCGGFDRHIRRMRSEYRRRRDGIIAEFRARVPSIEIGGIAAGLQLLLQLPDGGPTERDVERAAADNGTQVRGLGNYTQRPGTQQPAIVLGYGTPPAHTFTAALEELMRIFARLVKRPKPA